MKEYGISVEVTHECAEDHYELIKRMAKRIQEARDDTLDMEALMIYDPEKYRHILAMQEAARWRALPWQKKAEETIRRYRERLALWIAPWLESEYE